MLVAARGLPPTRTIALIILCMVFARTAAMVFNRLADWRIDQRNPRTSDRHRLISRGAAAFKLSQTVLENGGGRAGFDRFG